MTDTEAKERPILFSAPMVRALLAGTKTQTRRIVKGAPRLITPFIGADDKPTHEFGLHFTHERVINKHVRCPYGAPGDRLWVRETWRFNWASGEGSEVEYRADAAKHIWPVNAKESKFLDGGAKWKPSIFLQRQFSRLALEVTGIRVERLQEITEIDAKAEGVQGVALRDGGKGWRNYVIERESSGINSTFRTARDSYESLWESINGADSWAGNPWVWVVSFGAVKP